jgi:3-hydroxyacyl-CoA dehydrogenase
VSESSVVRIERRGDVAIVLIDNPPVNALSHAVRAGLVEAFRATDSDTSVRAVVLACAGKTFAAGADIKEFGSPPRLPSLQDVIAVLDGMTKPVVAALHGTALGGGLELALGCHIRVAALSTRLGLPEVKLGILPGAGGTQRLPRAIGALAALKMIVTGEPISAADALEKGLVHEIAEGDPADAAIGVASKVAGVRPTRLRDEEGKLAPDRANRDAFEAAATELTRRSRGLHAPHACIEAVRAALDLPFDEGLANERSLFAELVAGDQSKAQRHIFFAEREAAKLPQASASTKPRTIARAAIVGAGTMGGGIAIAFADAAIKIDLIEADEAALKRGLTSVASNYADAAKRGRLPSDEADRRRDRIAGTIDFSRVSDADIVVEAVFEDIAVKRHVFERLDSLARADAILATNTSYLDIDEIAGATRRRPSVVGMHFFSPANIMRLVEVVRGAGTSAEALAMVVALAKKLGKIPVIVGNCHGFVGNRMLRQRNIAAERVLLAGALPQEVDQAMVDFGFPMGPFAVGDLAGLDIGWRMRKAIGVRAEIADALAERGHFGRKTGRGFYRYEAGSREPLPDLEVEALIVETSRRLGIARRTVPTGEIVDNLVMPLINEGAHILAEGIAARPGDIDVIWVHGYGFPIWRGGPMFHADQVGLGKISERLNALAAETGDETLKPAPLIEQLASEGRGFATLAA